MAQNNSMLKIIWWNVQNFAHFEESRRGEKQWPSSEEEFEAKLDLVSEVLKDNLSSELGLIALAEVTRQAAEALRDRVLPDHSVLSLDIREDSDFNVAVIYPGGEAFVEQTPLVVPYVPRGTRPMAVIDHLWEGHRLRLVACHWTARFNDDSSKTRSELARALARYVFKYLEESSVEEVRHIVIVGDMNEEPFGLLEEELYAVRYRGKARKTMHWADKDVMRRYLYNVSWRFLGERVTHGDDVHHSAGTYYWEDTKNWLTLDHLIVDGSLVSDSFPQLDEKDTRVIAHPLSYAGMETPNKFGWNGREVVGGVSDHLPILATLNLSEVT